MPGMTLKIDKKSPLHGKLVTELMSRINMAEKRHGEQHNTWYKAEQIVNAFVPENADDVKRRNRREGEGRPAYTTIMIPYSYALLMASHTYWTSVFFGRSPIHQVQGDHGEAENQVLALETLLAHQVSAGMLMAPLYLWLYDAGKYGVGWVGTYWDKDFFTYTQLEEDEVGNQVYITNRVDGYTGNRIYNISPFEALPDPRVPVNRFQEGEFFAVYRDVPWNQIVKRASQNYYTNVDLIKATPIRRKQQDNQGFLNRPLGVDNVGDSTNKRPAWIGIYEVYVDLIPADWGLGEMKLPEKWVFSITADLELIIQAQPLGALHNEFPFDVLECEPEAYSLWNRGIPEVAEPLQNTMDWLINSHFYNIRAIGNGRFVADPSKIDLSQLESGDPGWIAVLRPEAWGQVTDIRQVFQQIQTTDPTANHMNDVERIYHFGERTFGISEQMFGALSGGRRTATEVRSSTGFGVSRLKTQSEYMSATGFTRNAHKLIKNSQQYYDAPMKLRIVGDQAMLAGQRFLEVTPELIAGSYGFIPVDGTLPVDRFAQATLWKDLMGQFRAIPELAMRYDIGKIFAWVAQLAGLKNLQQFAMPQMPGMNVQVAPDAALADQAQRGNVIPYAPSGAGPGRQTNVAATPTTNVGA